MFNESVPPSPSPEQPPLAPYDPPDPAPQAQAWRRAIRVVMRQAASQRGQLCAARQGSSRYHKPAKLAAAVKVRSSVAMSYGFCKANTGARLSFAKESTLSLP